MSYPAFEDQAEPWWTLREEYQNAKALRASQAPPVVEPPPAPPPAPPVKPLVAPKPEPFNKERQPATQSWTTMAFRCGAGRNQPRLFDNIKSQHTGTYDLMPLELSSSFDWVRNQSIRLQAEQKAVHSSIPALSRIHEASVSHGDRSFGDSAGSPPKELSTEFAPPSKTASFGLGTRPSFGQPKSEGGPLRAGGGTAPARGGTFVAHLTPRSPVRTGGFECVEHRERLLDDAA